MNRRKPGKLRLRVVHPVVRWLQDHGEIGLCDQLASQHGIDLTALESGNPWVPTGAVAAFLVAVQERLGDERFSEACRYQLADAYGPLRYIFWALSPAQVYRRAASNMHLVTSGGRYEILEERTGHQRWRYTSDDSHESRCLCLLRQVNAEVMPTLWGLPPARVEEGACLARGDECCEYAISWSPATRRWPTLLGTGLGLLAGAGLVAAGISGWPLMLALCAVGALLGQLLALRRQRRAAVAFERESHGAIERIARDEAAAREQLLEMRQRQDEWTRLTEQQLAERSSALEKVVSTVRDLQEQRVVALRGYSHDLRSPLTVIKMIADILRADRSGRPVDRACLDDLTQAVDKMDGLLMELMQTALEETAAPALASERLVVEELAERIRGELRALVFGKDIRTSVSCTREAPQIVQTDRLHFARIIDNLLSNAAKYTERGDIVVELDGPPDMLLIKISDSGRGIAEDALARVFDPRGSDERQRAAASHGLGLSVVVRLLSQLGGRLEVMSRVGVGTTFWVYLPQVRAEEEVTPMGQVVTIRRAK